MSLLDLVRVKVNFSELPVWRKIMVILCFSLCCTMVLALDFEHMKIDSSAPAAPNKASGEIYLVRVMHGDVRYATKEDAASLRWWEEKFPLAGIAFITAVLVLTTARPPAHGPRLSQ